MLTLRRLLLSCLALRSVLLNRIDSIRIGLNVWFEKISIELFSFEEISIDV